MKILELSQNSNFKQIAELVNNSIDSNDFVFTDPVSTPESIQRTAENKNTLFLIAYCDETLAQPVGFCITQKRSMTPEISHTAKIIMIRILPKYRRHGYAKALLEKSILLLKESGITLVHLDVLASNTNAIELYLKNGFNKSGILPNYCLTQGSYTDLISFYKEV